MTTYTIVRGQQVLPTVESATHIVLTMVDNELDLEGWRGTHAACLLRVQGMVGSRMQPTACVVPGASVWRLIKGAVVVAPIRWASEARDWLLDLAAH